MILYIILFVILTIFLYIRLKYRFWVIQPVFHFYDIHYWFNNAGIINHELPKKNRYTNFINIETIFFEKFNKNKQIKQFLFLIQKHYLKNKDNCFNPKKENIFPYFIGHGHPCFFSFYYEKILFNDIKTNIIIEDKKLIGTITSRPLNIYIRKINKKISVYYVDYLCVDKNYRKKNIAPQIIQTHEYNQSHLNKKLSISLFKREGELTGIVPLCIYKTYCFNMQSWKTPISLPIQISLLKGDLQNLYYLYDFIKEQNKWEITILPEISNLIELVKSDNIFVRMIVLNGEICGAYLFKKVCTEITKGKFVLSSFASIKGNNISQDIFIQGFKVALYDILKNTIFHYLCIENISDNDIIIKNLLIKSPPYIISPTAYFFYNFAYQTFPSNKVLIVN